MSAMTVDLPMRAARAPQASAAPLRLTGRGRALVWAVAVLLGLGGVLGAQAANAGSAPPAVPVVTYVVAPGETLWQIAGGLASPGEDVRDVVAELVELNELPGAGLQAGQQILLPASR